MAVVYSYMGGPPQLKVIPKMLIPGEAVEYLAELHSHIPGTVTVGTHNRDFDGELKTVIQILQWEDVPE